MAAVPGEVSDLSQIETTSTTYESDGAPIEAYLARPRDGGSGAGIIVIHEAFGPVEHIHDVARRFANIGYTAVAPNLYSRVGAPGPDDMPAVFTKMFGLEDAQTVRDLEGAAALLRAQPGSNGKVGVIGFCSGGRQTLLYASSSDTVDAAVDCWGGFIRRANQDAVTTPERPTPILDLVDQLHCPLYAVFGGNDQNPAPADARELEARLQRAHKSFKVEVFEQAGHAFLADYRPSYHESSAFELWPKIVAFFESHLR